MKSVHFVTLREFITGFKFMITLKHKCVSETLKIWNILITFLIYLISEKV